LAEYGIGVPVMNLGLGVERLAMIAYQSNDIRELTYPQFFPQALSDREIEIIKYYYGLNEFGQSYSLDEIGIKLNLTRERVRQLKDKAIRKMRRFAISKELKSYLS
ncbi:MAG TPA: sigma factor-like helix-turn-helix DNA-binding protein, partial [Chitinophagales bacterium]|nr:sigma factor-like helix-turn-helix DNA-binding protein [Chitinophagales bacterium]